MIFLEQTVNQILREEGQVIISLEDLQITWSDLESLFIGVYEQAKQYISVYDWVEDTLSNQPVQKDWAHIRHITYNAAYQRMMPDVPGHLWEFNPYTKNASSIINSNFALEVSKYPTIEHLTYSIPLKLSKEVKRVFSLPCSFYPDDFTFSDMVAYPDKNNPDKLIFESNHGVGAFDNTRLNGYVIMDEDYQGDLTIKSKYIGIKELDLSCELFYVWFKATVLQYIGAQKRQLDLTGVGLPFDINADGLLERGRQLMEDVKSLKETKQHWSNF